VRLRPRWKDQHRAQAVPGGVPCDVIAVARKGEASISQIARDFGISESCLQCWLKIADREDGLAPPAAGDRGSGEKPESVELRELRRQNKLLEQENEILPRATAYFTTALRQAARRERGPFRSRNPDR
jgi:transposase